MFEIPVGVRVPRSDRGVRYQAARVPPIADAHLPVPGSLQGRLDEALTRLSKLGSTTTAAAAVQLLRSESAWSSKIEQIQVGHRYIGRAMSNVPTKQGAALEVAGNIAALQSALDMAEHPLTKEDICSIHAVLLPQEGWAGELRSAQNWIGGADRSPRNARYVPPPHGDVAALMDDLAAYINRDDVPVIVQAAVAQAQFEAIHPFADGNGRVGRTLSHYVLRRRGVVTEGVAPISLALLSRKGAYMDAIRAYDDGDPHVFVGMFAESCTLSADAATDLSSRLQALDVEWRSLEVVDGARSDAVIRRIVVNLSTTPVMTVESTSRAYSVSANAARSALADLTAEGVLNTTTAARNLRIYEALDVFAAIEDTEAAVGLPLG